MKFSEIPMESPDRQISHSPTSSPSPQNPSPKSPVLRLPTSAGFAGAKGGDAQGVVVEDANYVQGMGMRVPVSSRWFSFGTSVVTKLKRLGQAGTAEGLLVGGKTSVRNNSWRFRSRVTPSDLRTPEEHAVVSTGGFPAPLMSPTQEMYKIAAAKDKEMLFKDGWMEHLEGENQELEEIVSDVYAIQSKGRLDALANTLEERNKAPRNKSRVLLGWAKTRGHARRLHHDFGDGDPNGSFYTSRSHASSTHNQYSNPQSPASMHRLHPTFSGMTNPHSPSGDRDYDSNSAYSGGGADGPASFWQQPERVRSIPVLRFPSAMAELENQLTTRDRLDKENKSPPKKSEEVRQTSRGSPRTIRRGISSVSVGGTEKEPRRRRIRMTGVDRESVNLGLADLKPPPKGKVDYGALFREQDVLTAQRVESDKRYDALMEQYFKAQAEAQKSFEKITDGMLFNFLSINRNQPEPSSPSLQAGQKSTEDLADSADENPVA